MRWVDAGAPGGNLAEAPPLQKFQPEDAWHIGKPDLVVQDGRRAQDVRRRGRTGGSTTSPTSRLTEDRYIKAMEIRPGNRRIVHHVVMYVMEPDAPAGTPEGGVNLHEYAVGKYGDTFAANTGPAPQEGQPAPLRHPLLR